MYQNISQELIDEFVNNAHHNLARVQEMLTEHPALLYGENSNSAETALQAASHMGRLDIVEYLLKAGAKIDIFIAAMLAQRDAVADFLADDPTLANARGVHLLTPIYFAIFGGDIEIAQMIMDNGGGDGLQKPLNPRNPPYILGAVRRNNLNMVRWVLEYDVDLTLTDFGGRTPIQAAELLGHTEIASLLRQHMN